MLGGSGANPRRIGAADSRPPQKPSETIGDHRIFHNRSIPLQQAWLKQLGKDDREPEGRDRQKGDGAGHGVDVLGHCRRPPCRSSDTDVRRRDLLEEMRGGDRGGGIG